MLVVPAKPAVPVFCIIVLSLRAQLLLRPNNLTEFKPFRGGGVLTKALFASCLCPFVGEIGSGPKEYNRFSKTPAFPAALGVAVRTAEPAGSVE